jgi:cell division initiation protein
MRMTPLDIQNHHFARRFSGCDVEEVTTFLHMVADDYESLLIENEKLRDRAHQLDKRVEELASGEKILRTTLVSAQAMSDELRQSAVRETDVLLGEAELRAEKILDAAHRRSARLAQEIREMRNLRKSLASALRASIEMHLGLIENLDSDPVEPTREKKKRAVPVYSRSDEADLSDEEAAVSQAIQASNPQSEEAAMIAGELLEDPDNPVTGHNEAEPDEPRASRPGDA